MNAWILGSAHRKFDSLLAPSTPTRPIPDDCTPLGRRPTSHLSVGAFPGPLRSAPRIPPLSNPPHHCYSPGEPPARPAPTRKDHRDPPPDRRRPALGHLGRPPGRRRLRLLGRDPRLGPQALGLRAHHGLHLRPVEPGRDPRGRRAGLRRGLGLPGAPGHPAAALAGRSAPHPAGGRAHADRVRHRRRRHRDRHHRRLQGGAPGRGGLEAGGHLLVHLHRRLHELRRGRRGGGPALGRPAVGGRGGGQPGDGPLLPGAVHAAGHPAAAGGLSRPPARGAGGRGRLRGPQRLPRAGPAGARRSRWRSPSARWASWRPTSWAGRAAASSC